MYYVAHPYWFFDHIKRVDTFHLQMLRKFLQSLLLLFSHFIHIKAIHMLLRVQEYMNGFYYAWKGGIICMGVRGHPMKK